MANPQKENGYTAIANEIMDALIGAGLSGQQFSIAMLVIRKTYGYQKKTDAISLSQMASSIGSSRIRCSQVVKSLVYMKILTVNENINGVFKSYSFNKDFDTWLTVNKNINRIEKTKGTVNKKLNEPLMKTLTTKEKKEKKTSTPFFLPEYIPTDTWQAYLAVRAKKRAAQTPYAFNLIIKELEKIKTQYGQDPVAVLNKSIASGWTDVYPLKENGEIQRKAPW